MSVLNSLKKALGFSDEYDYEPDETPQSSSDDTTAPEKAPESPVPANKAYDPSDSVELSGTIFDAVIKLFNDTQPEFVRQCLSVESQRSYILSHIEDGVRTTLERHIAEARAYGEQQAIEQRNRMREEIEKLKADYERLRHQHDEFQTAKLSASRQKRAMTERITDLETQVSNLLAEREQYQLENRSMANKLRIASMNIDSEELGRMEVLVEQNAQLADNVTSLSATNSELQRRIENLESQLAEAQSSVQSEESNQAALEEIEARLAEFDQIKERKNRRIEELQKKLAEATQRSEQLTADAESAAKESQELKAEVKRLSEMINAAESGKQESRRQRQSKKQKQQMAEPEAAAAPEAKQPTVKISAIDELMDSTDWFTAPQALPPKKSADVEEDFGYKEPAKPAIGNDSDKQLSLF